MQTMLLTASSGVTKIICMNLIQTRSLPTSYWVLIHAKNVEFGQRRTNVIISPAIHRYLNTSTSHQLIYVIFYCWTRMECKLFFCIHFCVTPLIYSTLSCLSACVETSITTVVFKFKSVSWQNLFRESLPWDFYLNPITIARQQSCFIVCIISHWLHIGGSRHRYTFLAITTATKSGNCFLIINIMTMLITMVP